jgi:formyltetrahydrofolate deformylase
MLRIAMSAVPSPTPPPHPTARVLLSCPDRPGIVAAVARLLAERGANIVSSHQYSTDPDGGAFVMRVAFRFPTPEVDHAAFEAAFGTLADAFGMTWHVRYDEDRPRVAILASRYDHCLLDLLWRWRRGELTADVTQVISNHEDLRADAEGFGVPYAHVPVGSEGMPAAEAAMLDLLDPAPDLVVLARYMRILSADFLDRVGCPVINIHHSFLPAFAGADPYARARERGVKIIGATAHYVTEDLDAGPIIEQDVVRVDHSLEPGQLEHVGRDIERVVLARAVAKHLDDRVVVDGRRTIVF